MPNARFKNYLHLHILVFIAGFTAILGELITIKAIPLVWFRMVFATIFMSLYIKLAKVKLKIPPKAIAKLAIAGVIIALHWITFFASIKAANISVALAMFSTAAFFASFIEPIIYKRPIIWYEIVFGIIVVVGVFIITQSEIKYLTGILLGIASALLAALFSVMNGNFLKQFSATAISFYEFLSGVAFISIYLLIFEDGFSISFFKIGASNFWYLIILASICTAYAFIASVSVMKSISPFSVVLTYNLEPVYGVILAIILFPEKEKMSPLFYYGALLILSTVILNGIVKGVRKLKRKDS